MSNTPTTKKDSERYFLQEFLKLVPELRELKPVDFEAPDFLCDVAGIKTGIEVTRFFFPSSASPPPQAAEGYRSCLSRQLTEQHVKSTITPAHVSVHLCSDSALLKTNRRAALKKELFSFVSDSVPPPGPHVEFGFETLPKSLSEAGVDEIWITNTKDTGPQWSFGCAAFLPESSASIVQGILEEKNALVPGYRKNAEKLWLLILSGTDGLHSMVHFDKDVLTHEYSTGFDRLFLFGTFGASAHELRIAPARQTPQRGSTF